MYTSIKTIVLLLVHAVYFSIHAGAQTHTGPSLQPIGTEAFRVMEHFFSYDKGIPLQASTVSKKEEPGYVREKIVFRSPSDARVPAYLALPKGGNPPYACVLLLHGIGSSKESWWQADNFSSGGNLMQQLVAANIAVMALDAEYHGERLAYNDYESPEVFTFEKGWFSRARDMVVQSVIETRRAMDYLATRPEIDTSRIGAIGFSMGGMMVFNLAALDPRVKVAVAAVTPILKEAHSAMAVHNFAPYIKGKPFLMLMGEQDTRNYSMADARQLYDHLPGTDKQLEFFKSGHQLPVEWTTKATAWMQRHLE